MNTEFGLKFSHICCKVSFSVFCSIPVNTGRIIYVEYMCISWNTSVLYVYYLSCVHCDLTSSYNTNLVGDISLKVDGLGLTLALVQLLAEVVRVEGRFGLLSWQWKGNYHNEEELKIKQSWSYTQHIIIPCLTVFSTLFNSVLFM